MKEYKAQKVTDGGKVKPKQSLGQNFLVDDNIARKIVQSLNIQRDDIVVEIGPGQGALTRHIVSETDTFIAYEIDGRVVESLKGRFSSHGATIYHDDFLKADLATLSKQYGKRLRIIGNIPYHLTSEIFFKVIDERQYVRDVTLMIQREVASRLAASPSTKEYGILSVMAALYTKPEKLFHVSPNCFYPKPKVVSAVIRLEVRHEFPYIVNEKLLKSVVRTSFGKRRKMLRNSLCYLPFEESKVVRILARTEPWLSKRPEQLSIGQFVELTNEIEQALQE